MIKGTEEAIQLFKEYFPNKRKMRKAFQRDTQYLRETIQDIADGNVKIWDYVSMDWSREDYDMMIQDLVQNTYSVLPKYYLVKAIAFAQSLANKHVIYQTIQEFQEK